jgi:hypothetical protein
VYPKLPLMFAYKWDDWLNACQGCVYDLKSVDVFDRAFDTTVKRMVTAALESEGRPGYLRQEYLTESFVSADRYVERLGLDRHEQAVAWSQLIELAIKKTQPPIKDRWIREQHGKLAEAYRRAMDLDKSTATFLKASSGSDDERLVRDLAREVQVNRDMVELLNTCKSRDAIEEYLRLYVQQNRPSRSSVERMCTSDERATTKLYYELTRLRDMGHHTPVFIGNEPLWQVSGAVGTGRRSDFMRSDELRYAPRLLFIGESHSLVLNGAPHKDVQVRFRVSNVEPADFRSSESSSLRSRRNDQPAPTPATMAFVFGVRDVTTWVEDPRTHKNLRPTTGWALQFLPDRIVLARLDETERKPSSADDVRTFSFSPQETQATNLTGAGYDVSIKIDGAAVVVVVGGRTYRFRVPAERTGFFGFDFHGMGYLSVGQLRVDKR